MMVCFNRGTDYIGQASELMITMMLKEVNGMDIYENDYETIRKKFNITEDELNKYREIFRKKEYLIDWRQVSQDVKDGKI